MLLDASRAEREKSNVAQSRILVLVAQKMESCAQATKPSQRDSCRFVCS